MFDLQFLGTSMANMMYALRAFSKFTKCMSYCATEMFDFTNVGSSSTFMIYVVNALTDFLTLM